VCVSPGENIVGVIEQSPRSLLLPALSLLPHSLVFRQEFHKHFHSFAIFAHEQGLEVTFLKFQVYYYRCYPSLVGVGGGPEKSLHNTLWRSGSDVKDVDEEEWKWIIGEDVIIIYVLAWFENFLWRRRGLLLVF